MARFTNAPLPSFRLLGRYLLKIPSNKIFLDTWKKDNHLILPLSRSAWSLKLIADYKFFKSGSDSLTILVPSYFCNSSLAPLREMKVNLVFYPIQINGAPNLDEVKKIISKKEVDIFLGVHFFGAYMDFTELFRITREYKIWFIEDFAHLFYPSESDKFKSDFQLFSPHKFLPIPDGALLRTNKSIFKTRSEEREFIALYNSLISGKSSRLKAFIWLIKRLLQKVNIGINLGIKDFYNDEQIKTTQGFFKPRMTNMSMVFLSILKKYFDQNNLVRLENAQSWMHLILSRYPSVKVLFAENIKESIYLLGFKFSDVNELNEALRWFKLKAFPVCTWPDLPEEVLINEDYFKNSIDLRKSCIFFHVHSSIDKKIIESSV